MKKLFILLSIGVFLIAQSNAQLWIPNGNFETWDFYNTWTLEPQYWETSNDQLTYSVTPDSSAYEGDLAMRVHVLPGFEGGIPQMASITIPASSYPDQLQFVYKSLIPDEDPDDKASITVDCIFEDAILSTSEFVVTSSMPEWEVSSLDIAQSSNELTEVRITIRAGYSNGFAGGSWDTWISVDAFEFVEFNAVEETLCESLLFPNPGKREQVTLLDCGILYTGIVEMHSITGAKSFLANVENGEIQTDIASGVYMISWTSKSGVTKRERVVIE